MSDSIASQHVRELAARKSKAYELLLALEQNPAADESCFQSLGRVVDRIQFNEISLEADTLGSLSGFLKMPEADLGTTLAVLAVAVSEAEPERDNVNLLLNRFTHWIGGASPSARPHFLEILPNIGALLKELGSEGVEALIACFNACSSDPDCDLIARCIVRYQETTGPILSAASELGSLFIRTDARPAIDKMLIAAPPDVMYDSKDARALLPAMAKLQSAASGDAAWSAGAVVCLAVAKHNHSSALNLARRLPGVLAQMPADLQAPYLKAFGSIIEEAGVSLTGYGSKQLAALFQKAGAERASAFVAGGIGIARKYGRVAAEEFFEQKTAAAKQAL